MITVLLADDHPVVRAGLRAVLETAGDIAVAAEAGSPDDAVRAVSDALDSGAPFDLVLMDLRFGEGPGAHGQAGGVDATARIRALPDPPQVLVVTNYSSDADILGAVSAGAVGYLLKDADPAQLVDGVRAAARGETVLSGDVATRLMGRLRDPARTLTARETEVLRLVADGLSNRDIAARLTLTEATVKSHLVHVFTKIGVGSRTAAVARAAELGML
ncbi:LuxR C-terminal-related transcriptional regulator [Corynebacterium xerosis]|jgi:DNA-binding NarL/FixJ family response regulator|uniref:Response regulator transcription factor n=1 Tax=Corynebacterium xerosis TaxID=1725 RepID=A0A7X9SYX1_9CORY|nr:response regulator transcription factor [Corynebacterium xerosis]NMF10378.1 response regulator transcription factor [Corynebacterium xerosis]